MAFLLSLPFFTALILFFIRSEKWARSLSVLSSLVTCVASFFLLLTASRADTILLPWLPKLGIHFALGLSGITPIMIALTGVVIPLILVSTWTVPVKRASFFLGLVHVIQGALFGVFMARDGFLFYFFWEAVVIASFFMILIWGRDHRVRHAIVFLLYSIVSSFLLLGVLIFLYVHTPIPHQFDLTSLLSTAQSGHVGTWFFWALCISFAIKIPLIPFHRWQPGTYASLPTPGSMVLGALVSKMGIYALIQFVLPVVSHQSMILIFVIVSLLYASLLALTQLHFKSLIAYVSIAHSSLIVAGLISGTIQGYQGAILQVVFHAILVVGLFLLESITARGHQSLYFRKCFFLILLGAISLPLTGGFVGEFMILWGISLVSPVMAGVAGLSVILGAWVMLNVYQRFVLNPEQSYDPSQTLSIGEIFTLGFISLIIFALGIFPSYLLNLFNGGVL